MQIAQGPPPPFFPLLYGPNPTPGPYFGVDDRYWGLPREHGFGGLTDRPGQGFEDRPSEGARDPAMIVAGGLAVMETLIGIRSDQLDAWRAFTSATLNTMLPSSIGLGMRASQVHSTQDSRNAGQPDAKVGSRAQAGEPDAFAMAERMADEAIVRGENAKALKHAIEVLRQKLTPEQLTHVKRVEQEMHEHFDHGPNFGLSGDGGPHSCSGDGMPPLLGGAEKER
jgi:hypothetical protein